MAPIPTGTIVSKIFSLFRRGTIILFKRRAIKIPPIIGSIISWITHAIFRQRKFLIETRVESGTKVPVVLKNSFHDEDGVNGNDWWMGNVPYK